LVLTGIESAALELQFCPPVYRTSDQLSVIIHSFRHPATNTKNVTKFGCRLHSEIQARGILVLLMKLKALASHPLLSDLKDSDTQQRGFFLQSSECHLAGTLCDFVEGCRCFEDR
jgi:hypothetical protein